YLAWERAGLGALERRLRQDPRANLLYAGENAVVSFQPLRNEGFILDWEVADGPERKPYPRMRDSRGRQTEGYVNALRVIQPGQRCVTLAHETFVESTGSLDLELSSFGPALLWLDGRRIVSIPYGTEAILGKGPIVSLTMEPGRHEFRVRTCRSTPKGQAGFYLLERGRG
ncbi:MAG: hypothetical protein LC732_01905, partial [Acidobacteria bacterium]|nr:hypothetical protein [Acidobacteriota bacterium]